MTWRLLIRWPWPSHTSKLEKFHPVTSEIIKKRQESSERRCNLNRDGYTFTRRLWRVLNHNLSGHPKSPISPWQEGPLSNESVAGTPDICRHNVTAWARLERQEHTQTCSADQYSHRKAKKD